MGIIELLRKEPDGQVHYGLSDLRCRQGIPEKTCQYESEKDAIVARFSQIQEKRYPVRDELSHIPKNQHRHCFNRLAELNA